jgi:autotransporter-associated beta strand protein
MDCLVGDLARLWNILSLEDSMDRGNRFTSSGGRHVAGILALAVLGTLSGVSRAADTWTGLSGTTSNWSDGANWQATTPPVANDALIFDGSNQTSNTNDFTAGTQFNGITFAATASPFTLAGNAVNLGGDVVNLSTNPQTVNTDLGLVGNTNFNATGATLTFGGNISGVSAAATTLTLTAKAPDTNNFFSTVGGVISNGASSALSVTVTGGIWLLPGNNTFTGKVSVTGGVLRAGDGTGLPLNAAVTLNGGAIESTGTISRNLGAGAGQIQLTGGASGFSANGNPLDVTLNAANSTLVWGTASFNPGTLTLNASSANNIVTLHNSIDLAGGNHAIGVGANTATLTGNISDSVGGGTLTKVGGSSSVLTLASGQSVLSSNLNIANGTVAISLVNPGTFNLTGNLTGGGTLSFPNANATINPNNPSTTITLSGNNSAYTGGFVWQAGTFILSSNTELGTGGGLMTIGNNRSVNSQTTFVLQNGDKTINNPVLYQGAGANNPGVTINGSDNLTFNGTVTGGAANQWYNSFLPKGKFVTFNGEFAGSNSTSARNNRFAGSGDFIINGPMSNGIGGNATSNSQITKAGTSAGGDGTGVLIVNSTVLSYSGGTTIQGGTMVFNKAGVLPPATNTGGTPIYIAVTTASTTGGAVAYAGGIQDPTFLSLLGGLNTSNTSSATGALAILSANDAATSINFNAAAVGWNGMGLGAAQGAYTYTGVLTPFNNAGANQWRLGGGDGTLTFGQVMSDGTSASTLNVLGGGRGVVVLTAQSTYTGSTTINAYETLRNGVANPLPATTLNINGNGVYDLNGFDQTVHGFTNSGTLTSAAPATLSVSVNINGTNNGSTMTGALAGAASLSQNGNGTLTLGGIVNTAGMVSASSGSAIQFGLGGTSNSAQTVGAIGGVGSLQILNGTVLTLAANGTNASVSSVSNLSLAGAAGAWTGKLELSNNILVENDSVSKATTLATIKDQVTFGASSSGTSNSVGGITSASVAADKTHKFIAVVDNALAGLTQIHGSPIDSNSIIVEATYFGDSNLDRKVDVTDLGTLATNYGKSVPNGLLQGDFNGDGKVDVTDLGLLATDYGLGTSGGFSIGSAAVPEPASLAALALGGAALLGRRRRR